MPITRDEFTNLSPPSHWLQDTAHDHTVAFVTRYPIIEYIEGGITHPNRTMLGWTELHDVAVAFYFMIDGRARAEIMLETGWNWEGYPSNYYGLCMSCHVSSIPHWISDDMLCCEDCERSCICGNCGWIGDTVEYNDFSGDYMCPSCYGDWHERHDNDGNDEYIEEERVYRRGSRLIEVFDAHEIDTPEELLLSKLPHRPIRFHSLEIEFGGSGNAVAGRLYAAGLSNFDSMCGYHGGNDTSLRVEHDSTVDAELIIPFLQPDRISDAVRLHKTLDVMRNLVKDEKVFPDSRCGNHHHVSAKGMNVRDIRHLVEIFGYLEDPLYRIASANWGSHRIEQGNDYASPIIKGEWRDDTEFGRTVLRNNCQGTGHSSALNLSNYYRAIRDCNCGAREFGEWGKCECRLSRDTIEFRLFNTTLSPRKMHAYMALTQSLVAVSQQKRGAERLPSMEYQYGDDLPSLKDSWMERLRWIFKYVPMADTEKQNVLYCIENSDMKGIVSSQFLSALQRTEYEGSTDEIMLPKYAFRVNEEEQTQTGSLNHSNSREVQIATWINEYFGGMPFRMSEYNYNVMCEALHFEQGDFWTTHQHDTQSYIIPSNIYNAISIQHVGDSNTFITEETSPTDYFINETRRRVNVDSVSGGDR